MGAFTRIKRPLSRKELIQDIGRRGRAALKSGREDAEYEFKSRASGRTPGKPHPDHGKPFPEKAITAWDKKIVRTKTEKKPKTRTFLLPGQKKGPKRNK